MTIIIDLSGDDQDLANKAFGAIDKWAQEMQKVFTEKLEDKANGR